MTKQKNPKISVLMPVYNTDSEHLKEAINSILGQTFEDFEFLILNDSPDNPELDKTIKSYNDSRIKYFKNNQNIGISASRNKLLSLAKGKYLAVMDHDDLSLPMRFERQVACLDNDQNLGIVGVWVDVFPKRRELHFPALDLEIKTLLTDICAVVHPSSMIRKAVLDNHNLSYEAEFSPSEDYYLWCRLIEFTKFHNIQEVLFKYRDHNNNTSVHQKQQMSDKTQDIHLFVRNKYPALYERYKKTKIRRWDIKLFGAIPLFKIMKKNNKIKFYLFHKIPMLNVKEKNLPWLK